MSKVRTRFAPSPTGPPHRKAHARKAARADAAGTAMAANDLLYQAGSGAYAAFHRKETNEKRHFI